MVSLLLFILSPFFYLLAEVRLPVCAFGYSFRFIGSSLSVSLKHFP